jgi:hypothetical protein
MPGVFARRAMVRLGDWTYAMYLFHIPLLLIPYVLGWLHVGTLADLGLFVAYCCTTVAIAVCGRESPDPDNRASDPYDGPSRKKVPVSSRCNLSPSHVKVERVTS